MGQSVRLHVLLNLAYEMEPVILNGFFRVGMSSAAQTKLFTNVFA
jgi:hypothetical protein